MGLHFRHVPAGAPAHVWPYLLFSYGALAAVLPWTLGNFYEDEFRFAPSLVLGVLYALPLALAARWLSSTPYPWIGRAYRVLASLWFLHLAVSAASSFRHRKDPVT